MDLDRIHNERLKRLLSKANAGDRIKVDEIFLSSRVRETIGAEKLLLASFRPDSVLPALPFSSVVYVEVCPGCVNASNFEQFSALVESGLIVPILIARYSDYPTELVDLLSKRDHMSCYEHGFYRTMLVSTAAKQEVCAHCMENEREKLVRSVKGKRGAPEMRLHIDHIFRLLHPYVHPDFTLIESIEVALRDRSGQSLRQLTALAESIRSLRTAQAFDSSVIIDASDLESLPDGVTSDADRCKKVALDLKQELAEGLGLLIPLGLPIEKYIGLVRDFQPQITKLLQSEAGDARCKLDTKARERAITRIAEINREIERVRGLKRYAALEVCTAFFKDHKALTASALLATALGVGGSLLGCAGTLAAGAAVNALGKRDWIGKSPKWFADNRAAQRLAQMIHRDLHPGFDKLVAKYAGAQVTAVRVMSLRQSIAERVASGSPKRVA